MKQLLANIKKEALILLRDIPGLLILFLMPALLIIVITLTQENAIQSVNKSKIEILFIDNDKDEFSKAIESALVQSDYFEVVKEVKRKNLNEDTFQNLISIGDYKAGIIIPENITRDINARSKEIILSKDQSFELSDNSNMIRIYFDPAVKEAFSRSVSNALEMIIQSTETRFFLRCFFDELPKMIDNKANDALEKEVDYFIGRTEQEMNQKLKEALGDHAPEYIKLERPDSMNVNLETILQQSLEVNLSQSIQNLAPVSKEYAGTEEDSLQPSMTQNNVSGLCTVCHVFYRHPIGRQHPHRKRPGNLHKVKNPACRLL